MKQGRASAPVLGGIALLERAIGYTVGSLRLVTPDAMRRPTPCHAWDVRALLGHMNDSFAALHEAIELGYVDVGVPVNLGASEDFGDPAADPVGTLCGRACRLLGAWVAAGGDDTVARALGERSGIAPPETRSADEEMIAIGDCSLTASIVASAGAVEVAVHGWDLARGCGAERSIPPALAEELLELVPLLVSSEDRPSRFAPPVETSPLAGPEERLLAFLGRDTG